jgi:peptide/nickel transport system substrate-binding protein
LPPAGANRNRYSNPEVDRLAELGRRTLDREGRRRAYFALQEILSRELPYVSLWYGNDIVAMDRRLAGFKFYPGGDFRSLAGAHWVP